MEFIFLSLSLSLAPLHGTGDGILGLKHAGKYTTMDICPSLRSSLVTLELAYIKTHLCLHSFS